jgi:hypothetical protein
MPHDNAALGRRYLPGAASLAEANTVELTRIVVLNPNIWI